VIAEGAFCTHGRATEMSRRGRAAEPQHPRFSLRHGCCSITNLRRAMNGESNRRRVWLGLAIFVSSGCGSASSLGKDAGTSGDGPRSPCPAISPAAGDPCDADGQLCAYGDAGDPLCRSTFICRGLAFAMLDTDAGCASIPCAPGTKYGDPCAEGDSSCLTGDGTSCFCSSCNSPNGGCGGLHAPWWHCPEPAISPCPAAAPNAGMTCSGALACPYRALNGLSWVGVCAVCDGSSWTWFPPEPCPPPPCDGLCCELGSTCYATPQTCASSAACPATKCCVGGKCSDSCPGTCAAQSVAGTQQFCADTAQSCSGLGPVTVVTTCAGGACCTDAARAVCCQVKTDG
jgi:hypothetical protein